MFNRLFDMLDGAAALRAALPVVRAARGAEARALAFGLFCCAVIFGWLAWYFDIDTTLQYTRGWHSTIMATLADSFLVYGPALLWLITLAPTIIRQSMSGVAVKFTPVAWMILVLNAFDMRTDWPRVRELFDQPLAWSLFDFAGPLHGALWYLARAVFLLFATDLFEVIFLVCVVSLIVALINSVRPAQGAGQGAGAKP